RARSTARGAPQPGRSCATCPFEHPTERVDCVVADARAVESGPRMPGQQPPAGHESVIIDFKVAGLNVHDNLPADVLRGFYLMPERVLVEFLTPPVNLFFRYPQRR